VWRRVAASAIASALVIGTVTSCEVKTRGTATERRFMLSEQGSVGYCGNGSLTKSAKRIKRLVVVLHGNRRNACEYATFALESVALAHESDTTLVLAPHFMTNADSPASGALVWSESGWKEGAESLDESATSSFDVVDRLISSAAERFVNLDKVTIVGHSAGAQFVNRFAATTQVDQSGAAARLVFRFVIANPSSYLFLDDNRPQGATFDRVRGADERRCPNFNDYKYGLAHRNEYAARVDVEQLAANYGRRRVVYLLGAEDVDPEDGSLDTSCEAELQGENRLRRGLNFWTYLAELYGPQVYNRHTLTVVADTGHDGHAMLIRPETIAAIFGD
jgi:poly(3-hydroxybutyrate) depolymerase